MLPRMGNRRKNTRDQDSIPTLTWRPGEVPPPRSPEAENAVLGTILMDQLAFASAAEYLTADDFFTPANQLVMGAMIRLFEGGVGIDITTVINSLRDRGELEAAGGPAYLGELASQAASSASIDHHAKIVREKAAVRRMIAVASQIVSEGYAGEMEPAEFLDRAESKLMKAGEARLHGQIKSLDQALDASLSRIDAMRKEHTHTTGVDTGLRHLNHIILGLQKSELIIIAARPSMGKTSFALNLALNAAKTNAAVLFASLEMSEPQLTDRLLCTQARFDSNRVRKAFIGDQEFARLQSAREQLRNVPLFIDDSPRMTVLELRAKARRMRQKKQLDVVMVDYLQLIDPSDKRLPREQQISEISRSLKAMAKELDLPVVALSQLSRAPETRQSKDKRPLLSDLRESGAIEQDADVVMFLYRPEYYDRDNFKEEEKNLMEVIVAKQRNGPTGTARLTFMRETMSIYDRENEGLPPT